MVSFIFSNIDLIPVALNDQGKLREVMVENSETGNFLPGRGFGQVFIRFYQPVPEHLQFFFAHAIDFFTNLANSLMYAIVDIETSGSYAAASGITEISIQVFDGHETVAQFETLINPLQKIPPYIQAMTGITDEMVADAPLFEEVAEQVYDLLKDKVFVAHSVNFDYSYIKSQLKESGYDFETKKLCTLRLSRKVFPGLPSYSLGNLCHSLHITHINRHRAGGDAEATVRLFRMILENDTGQHIEKSLKRGSGEQVLPPHLPKSDFDQLPYTPGVYYFHDEKGKIVYVGKARNIRYRVSSHFANNSTSRQKQNFMRHVHHISFQEWGTELMALIQESSEIKRLWPRFNASQKKREDLYGIVSFEDQHGYLRLAVDKVIGGHRVWSSYHRIENARAALRQLVLDFELCPRLCFIADQIYGNNIHDHTCRGACRNEEEPVLYNERVAMAIDKLKNLPSFAILDKGVRRHEKSCILVWKGRFYGIGFIPEDLSTEDPDAVRDLVTPYRENSTITHMLFDYAKRYPSKVIFLD